jgi:hypothetical protein
MCSPEIDLAYVAFPSFLSQIFVEIGRQRLARKEEVLKIHHVGLMAPWVCEEKFLVGTQFLFGTLMSTVGEDGNLELQVRGWPPR